MKPLSAQQLLTVLPHRYPFIMLDTVIDYDDTSIHARKNFTANEPYAQGHFPGNPIMPGVMIIESMAQASQVLARMYIENHPEMCKYFNHLEALFCSADDVKFIKVVKPGDQLEIFSTLTRNARNIFEFQSRVEIGNYLVASANLKAVVGL